MERMSKKRKLSTSPVRPIQDIKRNKNEEFEEENQLLQNFFSITSTNGKRMYYTITDKLNSVTEKINNTFIPNRNSLLPVPIRELRESIERELKEEQLRLIEETEQYQDIEFNFPDHDLRNKNQNQKKEIITEPLIAPKERLWVDKYSPVSFVDLLSSEKTNREVLSWIKQWDPVVFHKGSANRLELRPERKIILLSGSPGIGKTTLAHVLAKHAKYNPVEINASDDRGGDSFEFKLRNAIEMQSVFGDRKPNLLIIDEIDGLAPGEGKGAVKSLLELIEDAPKSTKKNQRRRVLNRPIICICNDLYSPVLRKLRQKALIFKLERPQTSRLVTRLMHICQKEGMQADAHTLSALCESADNDIRSCLNTLQFIQRKTKKLTVEAIKAASVGHKDATKGLFDIWSQIFTARSKKYGDSIDPSIQNESAHQNNTLLKFSDLYETITSFGENDRLIEGCFENLLLMRYRDPTMEKTVKAIDWISWATKTADFTAGMATGRYVASAMLFIHFSLSQIRIPPLVFPKLFFDLKKDKSHHENIINSFLLYLTPSTYQIFANQNVVLELIPHFLDIISPKIRPVNPKLLNDIEKKELHRLIDIFIYHRISFKQESQIDPLSFESTKVFKLDPPVDDIVIFEQFKPSDTNVHRKLTHVQKQIITHQVESESIRRSEKLLSERRNKASENDNDESDKVKEKLLQKTLMEEEKLKQKNTTTKGAQVKKDFFRRDLQSTSTTPQASSANKNNNSPSSRTNVRHNTKFAKFPVYYKFQEGFTNAVRRTVYVKDFI